MAECVPEVELTPIDEWRRRSLPASRIKARPPHSKKLKVWSVGLGYNAGSRELGGQWKDCPPFLEDWQMWWWWLW